MIRKTTAYLLSSTTFSVRYFVWKLLLSQRVSCCNGSIHSIYLALSVSVVDDDVCQLQQQASNVHQDNCTVCFEQTIVEPKGTAEQGMEGWRSGKPYACTCVTQYIYIVHHLINNMISTYTSSDVHYNEAQSILP